MPYVVRVTWAEGQYQGTSPTTISANVGNAVANGGGQAAIATSIVFGVGDAAAAGSSFSLPVDLPMLVGSAVADGSTGSVYIYSARVTWAELEYQRLIENVTINCNVGNANSGGPIGATFTVDSAIQMGTANAAAAGPPFGYSSNTQVTTFIANAVAAGKRASGFAWSVQTTPAEVWTPVLIES